MSQLHNSHLLASAFQPPAPTAQEHGPRVGTSLRLNKRLIIRHALVTGKPEVNCRNQSIALIDPHDECYGDISTVTLLTLLDPCIVLTSYTTLL
jgi:hypothetical protein